MRPPAQIIEQIRLNDFVISVAASQANWQVLCDLQPVYLIKQHWLQDRKSYPRTTFSSQAHAQNLADKLNKWFNTTTYTIRKI